MGKLLQSSKFVSNFQVINASPPLSADKTKTKSPDLIDNVTNVNADLKKRSKKKEKNNQNSASFKFKMDKITQQQNDVYFDSETKYVQSLPWTVKLQPNIYGGEGKYLYFLKANVF